MSARTATYAYRVHNHYQHLRESNQVYDKEEAHHTPHHHYSHPYIQRNEGCKKNDYSQRQVVDLEEHFGVMQEQAHQQWYDIRCQLKPYQPQYYEYNANYQQHTLFQETRVDLLCHPRRGIIEHTALCNCRCKEVVHNETHTRQCSY